LRQFFPSFKHHTCFFPPLSRFSQAFFLQLRVVPRGQSVAFFCFLFSFLHPLLPPSASFLPSGLQRPCCSSCPFLVVFCCVLSADFISPHIFPSPSQFISCNSMLFFKCSISSLQFFPVPPQFPPLLFFSYLFPFLPFFLFSLTSNTSPLWAGTIGDWVFLHLK